jgi:hypothetical protein
MVFQEKTLASHDKKRIEALGIMPKESQQSPG